MSQLIALIIHNIRKLPLLRLAPLMFTLLTLFTLDGMSRVARADRAFSPRFSANASGDITMAANTIMTASSDPAKSDNAVHAAAIQNGTITDTNGINNNNYMTYVDIDNDPSTFDSSAATLSLPANATVLWAGLYWGGDIDAGGAVTTPRVVAGNAAPNAAAKNQVKFRTPSAAGYSTLTAAAVDSGASQTNRYQCFRDVTTLVRAEVQAANGAAYSGSYMCADIQAGTGGDRYAGWSLVVAYRDSTQPPRNLTIFDGFQLVTGTSSVDIPINGFQTPPTGQVNARLGMVVYEGDVGLTGDQFKLNGVVLSDSQNPATNFFNSSISRFGQRVTTKTPDYVNQLAIDADMLQLANANNSLIHNNDTSATLTFYTNGDTYYPGVVTTSIDIYAPTLSLTKTVADLNGATPEPGHTLEYTLSVANTGQNSAANLALTDPIPANTTYVPGSLRVVSGANAGGKTDAQADDQADYNGGTNTVTFRLGTGATASAGGTFAPAATTEARFRVTVNAGVPPGTILTNSATLAFTTQTGSLSLSANAAARVATAAYLLSGTVFEDINYGGGAGRSLAASSGVARASARVELYDDTGAYKSASSADANGQYTFTVGVSTTYTVRVVSSTVTSSRPGAITSLLPVPTWISGDANRVGGEDPTKADAGNGGTTLAALNTATTTAQAVAPVTVSGANVTGIDFGFNFDTVVNTNDSGQGSLRQFLLNANALGNAGLAQSGQAAGQETALFMVSDGAAHPGLRAGLTSQLSAWGAALFAPASALPALTDANTTLDGATQTANVGDTNGGTLGSGGTVGADALPLALFARPEIEIVGANALTLTASGSGIQIKNIALYGATLNVSGANALVQDCLIGMRGDGTTPAATTLAYGVQAGGAAGITIRHNYIRMDNVGIRRDASGGTNLLMESNEIDSPSGGQSQTFDGIAITGSGSGDIARGNLIQNMRGAGTEIGFGAVLTNALWENNTLRHNGYAGASASPEPMGLVVYNLGAGSGLTLRRNAVTNSGGSGIVVMGSQHVAITQNRFANNGASGTGLAIDLDPTLRDPNAYNTAQGVTPNTGSVSASLPNNGLNYPLFAYARLNASGTLTLRGYVGSASGQSAFGGARVELYKAGDDLNNNGEKTAGDGLSVPHGEGQAYLGAVTTDANGGIGGALSVSGLAVGDMLTATATDANGNTSEFGVNVPVTAGGSPRLLLVKRITAINGAALSGFADDPNTTDDNDPNWPAPAAAYLRGALNGGQVRPGDDVEYTIYFLSAGTGDVGNVTLCDTLPATMRFVPDAFNGQTPANGGLAGTDMGLALGWSSASLPTAPTLYLTNAADGDGGQFFAPATSAPAAANPPLFSSPLSPAANLSGVICVTLVSGTDTLPAATGPGTPALSYGFVRFHCKVK